MTGNFFYLKLKTKDKNLELTNSVNGSSNLAELQTKISEATSIKVSDLKILFGYPRKPLDFSPDDNLEKCGIKSGDTLFVEREENYNRHVNIKEQFNKNLEVVKNPTKESLVNDYKGHIIDNDDRKGLKGIFLKKVVPSDNSCLFTSLGFVISGQIDTSVNTYMRQLVADTISSNPEEFSDAILGKPNNEYSTWILNPNSWGGAIELAVLSDHYGFEIAVLNSTTGKISRFGEDKHYDQRVFLLFDGIHYDPLYMDFPQIDKIQTVFPTNDEQALQEAEQLAVEAKKSRQYTDVNQFMIRCEICNSMLVGQLEAQKHAEQTGHTSFNEV